MIFLTKKSFDFNHDLNQWLKSVQFKLANPAGHTLKCWRMSADTTSLTDLRVTRVTMSADTTSCDYTVTWRHWLSCVWHVWQRQLTQRHVTTSVTWRHRLSCVWHVWQCQLTWRHVTTSATWRHWLTCVWQARDNFSQHDIMWHV